MKLPEPKFICMPLEIITRQDLDHFKHMIIEEMQAMLSGQRVQEKRTLKSTEVCKMLRISPATLQNMRKKKILNASKIGGTFYYLYEEIVQKLPGKKAG